MTAEERKKYMQEWHKNNPKWVKEYNKIPKVKEYQKQYKEKNQEKIKKYTTQWWIDNPDYKSTQQKQPHIKEYQNKYKKQLRQNPTEKIKHHLRVYITKSIKEVSATKHKKSLEVVGLESWDKLREHIESQWTEGMTWDNHGVGKDNTTWHIDHIIPLDSATTEDEIYKLNHYTNLKPMWGSDNIKKSNKTLEN